MQLPRSSHPSHTTSPDAGTSTEVLVWFSRGSTTATLCCMALRPAPSKNCNVCRTTQLGSCSKCHDDPTPSRCCTACTGCWLIRESHTRWRWSHSKSGAPQRQPISNKLELRESSLSQPSLTATQLCAELTVVGHSSAVSTFHQYWPRQTWFPLLSSCRLELSS